MKYRELGKAGIKVSQVAFGSMTMGPLQRHIPVAQGAALLREALERGINFIDTAQMYATYEYIREALRGIDKDVVIASKSGAKTYEDMEAAVEEAREKLDRDVIDIFLLHAVQRDDDLATRREGAWQCLLDMKAKGKVKAVGLSTHNVDITDAVIDWTDLDVIHPIFNKLHFGLINEQKKDPEAIIRRVYDAGIGVYAMKPLAGGHLYNDAVSALRYAFDFDAMHAVAVGMVKREELDVNLKVFYGEPVSKEELEAAASNKKMYISKFCKGCGDCIDACQHGAIQLVDEKAYIEYTNCILCGYCRKLCAHSAIRVI